MSVKKGAKAGDYVQVPLSDGSFGYGKVLGTEIAFLDLRTETEVILHAELYAASPLFRVWVMQYALKPSSSWVVVGKQPLNDDELDRHKYFHVDAISGELSIRHTGDHYPKGHKEWPATFEGCEGLERAAVWDPCHIESRLLDHFEGRSNKWVESLALRRD